MTHFLDTNVCISAMRGNASVRKQLRAKKPDDLGVSIVSIYELFSGVERCRNPESERRKVTLFLAPFHILPFDLDSAARSAKVRWILEKSGLPIGPYDLLLAGQALALNVTLVTRNQREFERVPGLRLENWED